MFWDVVPVSINYQRDRVIDKDMYDCKLCACLNYLVITYEVRDGTTRTNRHGISLISYNCRN